MKSALKAAGVAAAILAANLTLTVLAVAVYSLAIEPGRDQAFYEAAAPDISAWTGPIGGAVLFFLAGWTAGARRREGRDPLRFILVCWGAYVVLDLALGAAMAGGAPLLSARLAISLAAALAAGLAGVWMSGRDTRAS